MLQTTGKSNAKLDQLDPKKKKKRIQLYFKFLFESKSVSFSCNSCGRFMNVNVWANKNRQKLSQISSSHSLCDS